MGEYLSKVIALEGERSSNYILPQTDLTKEWSINPLKVNISWTGEDFVYDSTTHQVWAAVTNAQGDDIVSLALDSSFEEEQGRLLTYQAVGVGLYRAKVIGVSSNNYTIEGVDESLLYFDWQITKADIINISLVNTMVTYNGQAQAVKTVISGQEYTDCLESMDALTQYGDLAQISYSIAPSLEGAAGNSAVYVYMSGQTVAGYTVTAIITNPEGNYNDLILTATLTINKKQLDFDWSHDGS